MENKTELKKLGILGSFAIYIPAAILIYCLTKYLIPYLSETTGQETILFWFIVGGVGIFTPLIITAILILKTEGYKISKSTWIERLRFRRITKLELAWSIVGLILVGIFSVLIMKFLELKFGQFDHSPPFMSFEPLTKGRYWLLLVWAPYWILNIFGEEFLWRGVMMPRQEISFGKYTWIIH
ncbi:MAG: CPBP family intramembrane glutamate endopeptidase, partial [Candidatus Neomarinimicrobiota bacterium]